MSRPLSIALVIAALLANAHAARERMASMSSHRYVHAAKMEANETHAVECAANETHAAHVEDKDAANATKWDGCGNTHRCCSLQGNVMGFVENDEVEWMFPKLDTFANWRAQSQ